VDVEHEMFCGFLLEGGIYLNTYLLGFSFGSKMVEFSFTNVSSYKNIFGGVYMTNP